MPLESIPGSTPPATPAAAAVAAVPVAGPPPSAQTVTIPLEQLQAFTSIQTRLAQMETDQRARDETARAEQVKILAAKGQVEEALRTQREQAEKDIQAERVKLAQTEERARRYALDGELARHLSAQPLVAGGAEQLTRLWRDQFVVQPQGESFVVQTQDFQPVGAFIAAQLGRPEYAHFVRAQNPGGGTAGGTAVQSVHTTAANPAAEPQPKNFSEAVILHTQSLEKTKADPRLTPSLGFGLRPMARQA